MQAGNLSLTNAFKFLQEGQYAVGAEDTNQPIVELTRTINGDKISFEVHDNVVNFTQSQWYILLNKYCGVGSAWWRCL